MQSQNKRYDLIIIGAGPTGINIGIEASKAGLNFLILERNLLVNSIFNFPTNMTFFSTSKNLEIGNIPFISHADKPSRKEALEYYRRIYETFDLPIVFKQEVKEINKTDYGFEVLGHANQYQTKNLVIATGFYDIPNKLNIPGEDLAKVKHYYDDAHPYIGMNVLVVGGANSACDVALEIWQKGAHVTMAVRQDKLYQKVKYWILPNIENRIKEDSIKAYFNTRVTEITESAVYLETPDGKIALQNDYVLAMTGYRPDFEFLERLGLELDPETKVPKHNKDTLESNVSGLYVAGVINAGNQTSNLFIENTRDHGEKIISHLLSD